MSQKKLATVILPDYVYHKIKFFQKELSYKDNKEWSISDTVNLLLKFCLYEENDLIYTQDYSFFKEFTYGKESFLQDFTSNVLRSCIEFQTIRYDK